MTALQKYYSMRAEKVIKSLQKRRMLGYYCQTKEEALNKAMEIITPKSTISWGGSQSIMEIGLIDKLKAGDYTLFDRATVQTKEEIDEIYKKAFSADYYLMSSNAITLDGKLVNIDGNSNRVAALVYGPSNVIIVAGMNKIENTEELALKRARNIAAPINAIRLNTNTPCASTGNCHDCKEDECICCNTVITRMSRIKDRIKVILVGEELGY